MKKTGKKGRFWELMPAAAVLGLLAVHLTGVTFFLNRTVFFVELIALAGRPRLRAGALCAYSAASAGI